MKNTLLQPKPFRNSSARPPLEAFGVQLWILADSEGTGGAFNLFEVLLPAGYATPLYIHYGEDVRLTDLTLPAGFDRFVVEYSRAGAGYDSLVAQGRFQIEVLGSLPDPG